MKNRVLVLNSDSLASQSVCDERLSYGFKVNQHIRTIKDFCSSSKFNHLLNLPSCLSKLINSNDILNNCDFYTIDDEVNFNSSYIKDHFDAIFYFLHEELSVNTRFNESVISLLSDPSCPDVIVFNLQITKSEWSSYLSATNSYQYRAFNYFVNKVLSQVRLVTLLDTNSDLYLKEEDYGAFYRQKQLVAPAMITTYNGYSLFCASEVATSLNNSCNLNDINTIVLSSSLFTHHLVFGMSPHGATLLRRVHESFPNAKLVLVLDKSFYSYLKVFDNQDSNEFKNGPLPLELNSKALAYLNEVVASLIKVELFKEQDKLPDFPELLDGSYYGSELNEQVKEYAQLIGQCFVSVDSNDFKKLNADLVITDNGYYQRLAFAHHIACLTLNNNLLDTKASAQDFAIFNASRLDFLDLFVEQDMLLYPQLEAQGVMNYCPKVGHYGANSYLALEDRALVNNLSLDKVLSVGLKSSLELELDHEAKLKVLKEQVESLKAHLSIWLKPSSEQDKAVNKVAQRSNYTNSQRYQLQWQFLQYLAWYFKHNNDPDVKGIDLLWSTLSQEPQLFAPQSLKILSFGCSRGQETCDLLTIFNNQSITGADVSYDALASAKQLQDNLKTKESDHNSNYAQVSYLGNQGALRFVHSSELLNDNGQALETFDIVSAMTVLCRHPDTVGIANSASVYPFEDFVNLLTIIDSLVKKYGLLCLFNSNYRLEDSPLAHKYVKVFPMSDDLYRSTPKELVSLYENIPMSEKIGYVNKFAPSGEPLNNSDVGTIFLKIVQ